MNKGHRKQEDLKFLILKCIKTLGLFFFSWPVLLHAQEYKSEEALKANRSKKDGITWLVYTRVISDAQGTVRVDQNIVPNFNLVPGLRMEVGYRHGERSGNIGAYDHYKIELQSKWLFERLRLIARMSDNIVRFGPPDFSRTNYLTIAETKIPFSEKWEAVANVGYSLSFQKNNVYEATPETSGMLDSHGIYKFGIKYKIRHGFLEGVFGSYDVFNPYSLTQPFSQLAFDYELWEKGTLYSYYRYQYDKILGKPLNNFLGLGVKIRFGKA